MSFIKFTITDGVAEITLNRARKRNALTQSFLEELSEAVGKVASDRTARLLVLSAEGPVFCAGMDLGEMQERAAQPNAQELWKRDSEIYRDLLFRLFRLPVPTLAIARGPALAGGLGLVLACDIVLAEESAAFALPEPRRGISAAVVTPLLLYRIGAGAATYLLLSGRSLSAAEALKMGLCHEVVAGDELAGRERELRASILSGAPSALAKTKEHAIRCAGPEIFDQLEEGMQISAKARETDEAREGLAGFLEKRKPAWQPPY